MEDKNKKENSPDFNLPKEGTEERCYDEYTEQVDPKSGQLVTVKVEETKESSNPDHKVVTKEGLDFTKKMKNLQIKDFIDNVKTKVVYDEDGRRKTVMRAPKTAWIHNLIHLNGDKFDFTGREYLLPIYNTNDKEILLKTARQVEKTVHKNSLVLMADNKYKRAADIKLGEKIAQLDPNTNKIVEGEIVWVSGIYKKPCRLIRTRQGHSCTVATTHPIRKWNSWVESSELGVGDRIAVTRRSSLFNNNQTYKNEEIEILAFLLGDGYIPKDNSSSYTQVEGVCLDRYVACCNALNIQFNSVEVQGVRQKISRINHPHTDLIKKEKLVGKKSDTKFIPSFVFELNRERTALFLNRLWSTDGHVKKNSKHKYSIEYCSISKKMIYQVQALLWKFGIPSKVRENLPKIYKDRGELDRVAYILRIESIRGVKTFLEEIGALGKSENIKIPEGEVNSNRDTLPMEASELIRRIDSSDGVLEKRGTSHRSLYSEGLRLSPSYPLSVNKAYKFLKFFEDCGDKSPELIEELRSHLEGDVYWDKITSIEDMGDQECIDFTATPHHNYIVQGVITHNSTLLANELTVMSCLIPFFRNMYVSPSHVQTRTFSNDKLKPVLERSPMIARYMQDNKVSTQVFEKGFTNGSMTFLRSAFFSADRARGISSDLLCYDKDAYALTKEGWKLFKDIGWDTEFATRNPKTGKVEWHKPTEIIVKKHTGKMVTFRHQGFRLRVTDNHDMVVNKSPELENAWEKIKASELHSNPPGRYLMGLPLELDGASRGFIDNYPHMYFESKDIFTEAEDVVNEEVFCVTVPNHELIVKGDFNSKPVVCGNCVDELQDMIMDNLPVIAQCLSHSKYQYHRYAGTPKSFDNTIEQYWQNTTQNEWMVPCSGCSSETGKKWNFLDIKNVGKHGPICKFCGKKLDISSGQWQSTVKSKRMRGYRIPQLMVPWIREWGGDPWKTLVHEMEIYPEAQFYNEILGLSYDNAAKPVTRADVAMNCDPSCHFLDLSKPIPDKYARGILFAGVDWGEGNDGTGKDIMGKKRNASYTILTIGGMVGQKFQVVYIKKYMGKEADPDFVVTDIFNTCKRLNVRMIGVDWGHGWGVNNRLFRMYGAEKCVQFMYVDNQKEVRKWDPIGYKFQLMRNHVMSEVFFMFKEGKFLFPAISEWEWYLQDIMNISVEYIEYQRKLRYIHRPSDPDDCFHSLLYCKQVADVYFGKR